MKNKKEVETITSNEYLIELMERYTNLVYSICFKITKNYFDAQDLTQETFLSAYRSLHSFDGSNEKAWIAKIATNKCLDYVKSAAKKTLPTEDTYFTGIEDTSLSLEDTVLEQMEKEHLANICRSLKPPYDEIAVQYFCEELSVSEISVHTGKKHKTIQTQIYRAKQLLKKHLAKGDMIHGK